MQKRCAAGNRPDRFNEVEIEGFREGDDKNAFAQHLAPPPHRLLKIAQAFRLGATVQQIYDSCKYEPWSSARIEEIVRTEEKVKERGFRRMP